MDVWVVSQNAVVSVACGVRVPTQNASAARVATRRRVRAAPEAEPVLVSVMGGPCLTRSGRAHQTEPDRGAIDFVELLTSQRRVVSF